MLTRNLNPDNDHQILLPPTDGPDAPGLNRRGIARLQKGDTVGALADFRAAALRDANYPEPWNNSGLVRQTLGQLAEAVADFDRALAIRPDYPEALTNRGRARQALGDTAGARADFDRALVLAEKSGFATAVFHNRGTLRQQQGDWAGALADFDRALEIDPTHTATYIARGITRKERNDLEGALADFDRALEQNPSQGLTSIYHGRGGVRVLLNDFAGAIADYEKALSLEPDKFYLYISRGNARYHGRDPRAVLDFRLAFRLDPDGAAQDLLRILTKDVERHADAVLENCTKHLRLNSRDVVASARRGLTLVLLGRDAEAEPDLARVEALVPDMVPHLRRMIELARVNRNHAVVVQTPEQAPATNANAIDSLFAGSM